MAMQILTTASRLDWAGWVRGIIGAFVSGGAGAIGAGTGTIVVDPEKFNVSTPQGLHSLLTAMGIAFLVSGIISLAKFLQTHPVPDDASPKP